MKITALLLPLLAAALFSSCASVSVQGDRRAGRQPTGAPAKIYVADFAPERGSFKVGGEVGKDVPAFKKKTAGTLSNFLVRNLSANIAPAQRVAGAAGLPAGGWLVSGEFLRVNTGSRLLRAGVGLGAGGTKMETRVAVTDLSRPGAPPFLTFETTGGSNAMPGLLTNPGTSAALSMLTQAMMGVTDDASRTSRMITGTLSEYLAERGWLGKNRAYSAKRPGKYRLIHQQYVP